MLRKDFIKTSTLAGLGLEDEGWGSVRSQYLDSLLKRLVLIPYLVVKPTGLILKTL
jgi:hypothetical protein